MVRFTPFYNARLVFARVTADDFDQHDVPAARLFIAHQLTLTAEQSSNVVVTFASAASRQRQVATTKITHSPYFED